MTTLCSYADSGRKLKITTERNDVARLKCLQFGSQWESLVSRNGAWIEIHHGCVHTVSRRDSVAIKSAIVKLKGNRQQSTMSSNHRPPRATTITNPPSDYYRMSPESSFTLRTIPFVATDKAGIGTMLTTQNDMESVLVNPNGDAIRLNEVKNSYALKLASLILTEMRKRKDALKEQKKGVRLGERASFDAVITKEMETMAEQAGYEPETKLIDRRRNTFWAIMRGFNTTDGSKFNKILDKILSMFIVRRMGLVGGEFDEFEAAVNAVQDYYVEMHSKENKTRRKGQWTFPGVHLLNGHLLARRMTPIAFSPNLDDDEECKTNERSSHDTTIWIAGEKTRVETRQGVLNQYKAFMMEVYGKEVKVPDDEGAPVPTRVIETNGKRRRSFDFGASPRKKKASKV